jgi:hypothetical protein
VRPTVFAAAIQQARDLQREADESWPLGYQADRVLAEATRLLRIFEEAGGTPIEAKALVEQLEEVRLAW